MCEISDQKKNMVATSAVRAKTVASSQQCCQSGKSIHSQQTTLQEQKLLVAQQSFKFMQQKNQNQSKHKRLPDTASHLSIHSATLQFYFSSRN